MTSSTGQASIGATINGASWNVAAPYALGQFNSAEETILLTAADPSATYGLAITLAEVAAAGTYALEDGFPLRFAVVTFGAAPGWGTMDGGEGSVTITSFTDQRIQGTFAFTAVPANGSEQTENLTVSSGHFDVPVIVVQ